VAGDIVQGEAAAAAMDELRTFMFERVYLGAEARAEHARIQRVIRALFDHYCEHPEDLPPADGPLPARVTDWIAGMTDRFSIRTFEALSVPSSFAP
jgi:dGTPase